jgi:aminoglycoside phosphotransferase (APT) family kinase protein
MRRVTGTLSIDYVDPPQRIAGGFDTTIYSFRLSAAPSPFDVPLIVRIYREEQRVEVARFETAVHGAVGAQGYPAPPILATGDSAAGLGGAFVIMPLAAGRTMLEAFFSLRLFTMVDLLASSQARLHALDVGMFERALSDAHVEWRKFTDDFDKLPTGELDINSFPGLRPGVAWISANAPATAAPVICHGDFHPLNLIVNGSKLTAVIDWTRTRVAPAEFDVGGTVALIKQGPVQLPRVLAPFLRLARRGLAARYVAQYRKHRPLDEDGIRYFEAVRCFAFLYEVSVVRLARAGVIGPTTKPTAFEEPQLVRSISARFREITGITIEPVADRQTLSD